MGLIVLYTPEPFSKGFPIFKMSKNFVRILDEPQSQRWNSRKLLTITNSSHLYNPCIIQPYMINLCCSLFRIFIMSTYILGDFFQVLKFLMDRKSTNSLHGQVTIGTLILQVKTL